MSTLSQFFGGGGTTTGLGLASTGSQLAIVGATQNVAIPSNVKYVAYAVMGAGSCAYGNNGLCSGGGGGFSYREGCISCGSPFNACVIIGGPGTNSSRSTSSITGLCNSTSGVSAICATSGLGICLGIGYLGIINNPGGCGFCNSEPSGGNSGGGGAGGLLGKGGNVDPGPCSGGGGFGSGGGGGGGRFGSEGGGGGSRGSGNPSASGDGGGGLAGSAGIPGYIVQFVTRGDYSQGKTYFAAAGGGGRGCTGFPTSTMGYSAGAGGGGGYRGAGGFGGGAGGQVVDGAGFGGGAAISSGAAGGSIAMIEWFDN
jgi:hypothetical protein